LRRQGAGEERDAVGEMGFERLPEDRKTFGQLHTVDPELHIGMLAADMDFWPKLSCATPGICSRTWFKGGFSPCGIVSSASGLKV
jgi:hypothetical protein